MPRATIQVSGGPLVGDKDILNHALQKIATSIHSHIGGDMSIYRGNPVEFCHKVLNLTNITDDQIAILQSVSRYQSTIVKSATGVGKTFIGAAVALYFFMCYDQVQVYTAAAPPEKNLKELLWGEIDTMSTSNSDALSLIGATASAMHISKSRLDFITGVTIPMAGTIDDRISKFSGKHRDTLIFILDEGDAIPDEIYRAIDGCMSGGSLVRLLIFYNPKKRSGEVYRKIESGEAHVITMNAFSHPNVITGNNVIPGAVTRNATLKRIHTWTEELPPGFELDNDGQFLSSVFRIPDYMIGLTAVLDNGETTAPLSSGFRQITDQQFYYKVLGAYASEGEKQLFREADISAARSRYDTYYAKYGNKPPEFVFPVCGLDVGGSNDPSVHCERYGDYVAPFIKLYNLDADAVALRAIYIYNELTRKGIEPEMYNVDAIGIGSAVSGRMSRGGCRNVTPVKSSESAVGMSDEGEFARLRDELFWLVRLWIRGNNAMLPPDKNLLESMRAVTYGENSMGRVKVLDKEEIRKLLGGRSPDELDALCMTFAPKRTDFGRV